MLMFLPYHLCQLRLQKSMRVSKKRTRSSLSAVKRPKVSSVVAQVKAELTVSGEEVLAEVLSSHRFERWLEVGERRFV